MTLHIELPETDAAHYLTGTSAMAIPSEDSAFVDWHFVDGFLDGKASFRIAGTNFPETTRILGNLGVRECGETLRRAGVPLPKDRPFYAANRDRALLDMLLANLSTHRRPDHLRLKDFFDSEAEQESFEHHLDALAHKLEDERQRTLLAEWRAAQ